MATRFFCDRHPRVEATIHFTIPVGVERKVVERGGTSWEEEEETVAALDLCAPCCGVVIANFFKPMAYEQCAAWLAAWQAVEKTDGFAVGAAPAPPNGAAAVPAEV